MLPAKQHFNFSTTGSEKNGKLLKTINVQNLKDFIMIGAMQALKAQRGTTQLSLLLW